MTTKGKIIRITLCAPGDVRKELEIITRQIEEWNLLHWDKTNCGIKVRHWLTDASPDMSDRPQAIINKQIVDEADILVAVFWSRFGSPTGVAASGTEEEIRRGIALKKRVLIYFSDLEPLPPEASKDQLDKLQRFREEILDKGLAWKFKNRAELKKFFQVHLTGIMHDFIALGSRKNSRRASRTSHVSQSGQGNTQIVGDGNQTTIFHRPPVIKQVTPAPTGSVSPAEQRQIADWIESLSEASTGKTRGEAYAMWWSRLKRRFKVQKYEHIQSSDMSEVHDWYRKQMNISKAERRTKAPDQWRVDAFAAIKTAMKRMGRTNEDYYPEISRRLKISPAFESLSDLTKTNLTRVQRLVLADARK